MRSQTVESGLNGIQVVKDGGFGDLDGEGRGRKPGCGEDAVEPGAEVTRHQLASRDVDAHVKVVVAE